MSDVDYRLNDADEHYYEPDDCFTRHIEAKFRERTVRVERSGPGPGPHVGRRRALPLLQRRRRRQRRARRAR